LSAVLKTKREGHFVDVARIEIRFVALGFFVVTACRGGGCTSLKRRRTSTLFDRSVGRDARDDGRGHQPDEAEELADLIGGRIGDVDDVLVLHREGAGEEERMVVLSLSNQGSSASGLHRLS
jgi:hypothetical protein